MRWPRIPYPRPSDRRSVLLAWAIPLLALFGPVLLLDRTFAFRDAAHYYAPLFRYVQGQWSEGLPLWNPLEENGRPLLADPTASVLYPGKLVFALPCGFRWNYGCYIVGHVALAAWAAYLAARSIGCGVIASGFGGLAYAFGGSVCFQYCNAIYLVGAAWLPLGVMALMLLMGDQPRRGLGWLSLVLAMTVLGGDPQTAYVLVLAGLVYLLLAAVSAGDGRPPGRRRTDRAQISWLAVRGGGLSLACLVALGLTAVQVWPSWGWARVSERTITSHDTAQSLPDWIGRGAPLDRQEWSGLYRTPDPGSHRDVLYRFSVGPWRWPELIWPNVGGRPFPVHRRWINAIPAEDGFWTPSLYMGLWPALLGLTGLTLRRSNDRHGRWLSWLVVGSVVACLGQYGLGWLWDELRHAAGVRPSGYWSPVGGLYWLMTLVAPGFILFRYPAKLWTLAALGLSLLASRQLQRLSSEDIQRWRRRMRFGLIVLPVALLIGWLLGDDISHHMDATAPDGLFGPLDSAAAWRGLLQGGLHLLVVVAVSIVGLQVLQAKPRPAALWILFLTAVELAWSQPWMVPTVPQRLSATRPPTVDWMESTATPVEGVVAPCFLREQMRGWYPKSWARTSSPRRLEACVLWDRLTLRPKYHLDFHCRAAASITSFSSADYQALLRLLGRSRRTDPALYSALLNVMGIEQIIAPADAAVWHQTWGRPTQPGPTQPQDFCLIQNPAAFSRAWIVHHAQQIAPLHATTWSELDRRTEQVFRANGRPRDLSQVVMIEADTPEPRSVTISGGIEKKGVGGLFPVRSEADSEKKTPDPFSVRPPAKCVITVDRPTHVEVEATLSQAGFLVLNDAFAEGWTCECPSRSDGRRPLPVLRANRVMRCVALPAGSHRVVFRYRPRSVFWGGLTSGLCWVGFGGGWLGCRLLDRRARSLRR